MVYKKKNKKQVRKVLWNVSEVLVITGAINWGLVGVADFNLVSWLTQSLPLFVENVVYSLVGIAGIYLSMHYLSN